MTAVFVHGVPETAELWDKVRAELDEFDSIALPLPGFGVPVPDGFGATMDEYAEWLIDELERLDAPVDLVGHDWGGLLTGRLVSIRPDLVRSWVADCIGGFDPEWEWHDVAKLWQKPGEGEQVMETIRALPLEQRVETFSASFNIPPEDARSMLTAGSELMDDCILKLYRSAAAIEIDWGPDLGRVDRPGMALLATEDPFMQERWVRRVAERTGARFEKLAGVNHFWPYETPGRGAALLRGFWSGLPS